MLIILKHLMYRLKVAEDLPDIPHPCDYFDLIGGTGTGGLIALMLGRLRMSVEDAIKAYGELSKEVFSHVKPQAVLGGSRLPSWRRLSSGLQEKNRPHRIPRRGWKTLVTKHAERLCVQQLRQTYLSLFYFEHITPLIIRPWTVPSGRQAEPLVLPQHSSNRLKLDVLAWRKHF
ncbi:hypothetical protein B0H14DRAFT_1240272 [Mycena olivaceomarginata]|nr:hypothetical protein B0H14DRAFT_1240272 [Mycena olivaceomarginata]